MKWDRARGRPEPIRALNRITERENGEPLVDLRELAPHARIGRPQTIPYCRETVARLVERAACNMPTGVFLTVVDAWRPLERQRMIYEFMMRCALEAFPDLSFAALRRRVNRWVAPVDQKTPPGHCTGAALDVWLTDEAGEQIDVISPLTRFHANPTFVLGLSERARANRMTLYEVMIEAGFSNCRDEWWHYSYGDAAWAVRTDRSECVYGRIALDPAVFEEPQMLWVKALEERPNPFLPTA